VVVPMDGFHLHDAELAWLGLGDRKGAPETFDVAGYVALLRRLRSETDHVVYAPEFDRSREESVAGAIAVRPEHRLVVTEGNYLLDESDPWPAVQAAMDEVWFVDLEEDRRRSRLLDRHIAFGKEPAAARAWVDEVDEPNARRVTARRHVADLVIQHERQT
jgi:pantothenate kinase